MKSLKRLVLSLALCSTACLAHPNYDKVIHCGPTAYCSNPSGSYPPECHMSDTGGAASSFVLNYYHDKTVNPGTTYYLLRATIAYTNMIYGDPSTVTCYYSATKGYNYDILSFVNLPSYFYYRPHDGHEWPMCGNNLLCCNALTSKCEIDEKS